MKKRSFIKPVIVTFAFILSFTGMIHSVVFANGAEKAYDGSRSLSSSVEAPLSETLKAPAANAEPTSQADPTEPTTKEPDPNDIAEPDEPKTPDEVTDPIVEAGIYNIVLSHEDIQLPTGENLQLTAELVRKGEVTTSVTWNSSDPSVAIVDANGVVHTLTYGETIITARTAEGLEASCHIQTRFADVMDPSKAYFKPVYWASDNKITALTEMFYPTDTVTRKQAVTFLWRMAGKPAAPAGTSNIFSDVSSNDSSYTAIMWAIGNDIIRGFHDGTFHPQDPVLRRQLAVMLWRWQNRPFIDTDTNPFPDISSDDSSCRAVIWGANTGIIRGSNGLYKPADDCQRQQVVTFLYRYAREMLGMDLSSSADYGAKADVVNNVESHAEGFYYSGRIRGIDISSYQRDVDFEKAKADGIQFVIFREGFDEFIDPYFRSNVKKAQEAGMWIPGVYHFCYAETKKDVIEEAKAAIKHVEQAGLGKDTVIFFDFEYDTVSSAAKNKVTLTKKECIEFTRTFCNYIQSQGYKTGIYTNRDYYNRMYDKELIDSYILWLAVYYSGEPIAKPNLDSKFIFWQYSCTGKVDGISGNVDLNIFFAE